MKNVRMSELYSSRWRGAGVVEQGRLLSDCADKNRYRGFESHPLRHINILYQIEFPLIFLLLQ